MLNIVEGKVSRAVKCVIYGPEGIGKSTMASQAPNPLFDDVEQGTAQLDIRRISSDSWEQLLADVKEVAINPHICKTLVIDTADRCEIFCIRYICKKYKQANLEAFNYGKGYQILSEEFARFLDALDEVIDAGINVIILAHAKMRKQELPDEAGSFDRWELKLTRQVSPLVKEWGDLVLFLNYKTFVYTTDNDTKKARGGKRVCYATHNPCWDAKNRHGLPDEFDMDYSKIAHIFSPNDAHEEVSSLQQVRGLMDKYEVTEQELQMVVSQKGKYPIETALSDYDEALLRGWIIPHWEKLVELIIEERGKKS